MKKTLLLIILVSLSMSQALAQQFPSPIEVEPASLGTLPTLKDLPAAEEKTFVGLICEKVQAYHYDGWSTSKATEAQLRWPAAKDLGGESYTLQCRKANSRETWKKVEVNLTYNSIGYDPIVESPTEFRLILHGGEKDGYTSNVLKIEYIPSAHYITLVKSWGITENFTSFKAVDSEINTPYVTLYVYNKKEGYTEVNDSKTYKYSWYRRNPNNYRMEVIEGANDSIYTPTMEDVGYEIITQVTAPGTDYDFMVNFERGIVQLPVQCSVAYIGNDGFVLNSAYEIPDIANAIGFSTFNSEQSKYVVTPFGKGIITEKEPGKYAFHINLDDYNYNIIDFVDSRYIVSFFYDMGDIKWKREAQIMSDRYMAEIAVKPVYRGRPVPTTVDIIGRNINDELVTMQSVARVDGDPEILQTSVFRNNYYLKARKTASTLNTYYPSALFWSNATPVMPELDEEWNPKVFTIDVQSDYQPMIGHGVLEGDVYVWYPDVKSHSFSTKEGEEDSQEATIYTVYLKAKDGDIIADTETNAEGHYRFENVPYGKYDILLDVEGRNMTAAHSVEVTEEKPTISNLNYSLKDEEIIPTGIKSILANGSLNDNRWYTSDGKLLPNQPTQPGIYINGHKKVVIK